MIKKPVPKINTNDITIIEWKDAQCDADWGEIEPPELAKVVTAGFLISENKEAICIGSTWADPHANARIHIPKAWISSRRTVNIKKDESDEDRN